LIVLHGAYMNIPSMGAIIPMLAKTHKVYALEFQGDDRTTDIDRLITYLNLADDVAAWIRSRRSSVPAPIKHRTRARQGWHRPVQPARLGRRR
jgi:hypothetical protein